MVRAKVLWQNTLPPVRVPALVSIGMVARGEGDGGRHSGDAGVTMSMMARGYVDRSRGGSDDIEVLKMKCSEASCRPKLNDTYPQWGCLDRILLDVHCWVQVFPVPLWCSCLCCSIVFALEVDPVEVAFERRPMSNHVLGEDVSTKMFWRGTQRCSKTDPGTQTKI